MILKEISGDPISDNGSHIIPYNSHAVTVIEFLDYLETCGRKEWAPRGISAFCSVRVPGLAVLSLCLHPCVLAFLPCCQEDPLCSQHSLGVTNIWHTHLLKIRALEVLVWGQMAMFALGYAVKQCVVSQNHVTKQSQLLLRKKKVVKTLGPLYPLKMSASF